MKGTNFLAIITAYMLFLSFKPISVITDSYEDRPHFVIETRSAIYYYDKSGGGFSRIFDVDGNDWVNFNGDPKATYPSGASGGFRGIPNLVFGSEDGGAGHPGFNKCISKLEGDNIIRTTSKSGKWEWTWTFYDNYAALTVIKADLDHKYWFLYEGLVAGSFNPGNKYWGTNLGGPYNATPSLNHGEYILGNWNWAYFGDFEYNRILFVAQDKNDDLTDHFSYMGDSSDGVNSSDGMVVFGFGRDKGAKPLLTGTTNSFNIGFIDKKVVTATDHEEVKAHIFNIFNK
ncbi:hypothetical protein BA6E_10946 [Bacteroidales bacterium 6E]|nr:hypothetical protein BA6E_10946 [Bacteroidales bacterium 6E]